MRDLSGVIALSALSIAAACGAPTEAQSADAIEGPASVVDGDGVRIGVHDRRQAVAVQGVDRYCRLPDGRDVNRAQVRAGWALAYRAFLDALRRGRGGRTTRGLGPVGWRLHAAVGLSSRAARAGRTRRSSGPGVRHQGQHLLRLRRAHLPRSASGGLRGDPHRRSARGALVLHRGRSAEAAGWRKAQR